MGLPKLDDRSEKYSNSTPNRMTAHNEPNQRHVSGVLWILFGLSLAFLVGVQIYVGKVERATSAQASALADQSVLTTQGPIIPVTVRELWLSWEAATGATHYELRIHSVRGNPVVDPVIVYETQWRPSDAVVPGLVPGGYRWTVEALDSSGQKLAESATGTFKIG